MATPTSTSPIGQVLTFPRVEAPVSAAECDELKKPAAHRKILEEIDRLLGLADVAMGDESGGDAPNGERQAHPTGLISTSTSNPPTHSTTIATIAASSGSGRFWLSM